MCEYCNEDDKAAYDGLIAKVAKVDAEAAEWMKTEALALDSFHYDDALGSCFVWADTPQGHGYWYKTAIAIGHW